MNFKKAELNKMINKIRMEKNNITWDDVDRYSTKEERQKHWKQRIQCMFLWLLSALERNKKC